MELHVAGDAAAGSFEGVQLGVVLAAPVGPDDGDGRPGGVVVEGDPADRARLPSGLSTIPLPGAADLRLDLAHDAADGVMVRLVDHRALGVGRGEGPCDRNRLRRGERQVDVTDPCSGRVHPLVILLHGQLAARGGATGQDVLTLLRGQRCLLGAESGLETPDGPLRGLGWQCRAVHLPASQDVFKLGARGHPALVHSEDRSDPLGRRPSLLALDVAAIRALAVQEIGDLARGEGLDGVDAKPLGECRVHVPAGRRRRAAVVLAGARLLGRAVEPFAGAWPIIAAVAGAAK